MTSLTSLKRIDNQIQQLDAMIKRREYKGAGITLDLGIGARPKNNNYDDDFEDSHKTIDMDFGISTDVDAILQLLRKSLLDSQKFWLQSVRKELQEIQLYLSEHHNK